jgi:hypothetical protein
LRPHRETIWATARRPEHGPKRPELTANFLKGKVSNSPFLSPSRYTSWVLPLKRARSHSHPNSQVSLFSVAIIDGIPLVSHETNGHSNQSGNSEPTNGHQVNEADNENAEYYQTFLRRLIDVVSHGQPEAVDSLIATIRSGASQAEIFRELSELTAGASSEPASRTQAP